MRFVGLVVLFALVAASCSSEASDVGVDADRIAAVEVTTPGSGPIQLCSDVEIAIPSVIATPGQNERRPHELDGVLRTYAAEHLDTYGGFRIAPDQGGTLVLAFTDDPRPHLAAILARRPSEDDIATIIPRPPMTAEWTVGESGFAVDVVQVEFTQAALTALQSDAADRLFGRAEFLLDGMGSQSIHNRVSLDLLRPTEEALELIASEFPDRSGMFCLVGELWDPSREPPSVDAPFTVMADAGGDPLVDCRTGNPFVLSALDGPPDIDPGSTDPLVVALMELRVEGRAIRRNGWRMLTRDDQSAVLANFEIANKHLMQFFENTGDGWSWDGSSAGECRLRYALPEGLADVDIFLDAEFPLDPASTTVHLLVSQAGCASGASGIERMQPPEVIETDDVVRVALGVVPPEGSQDCPSNELAPISIELSAPLGERELVDGIWVEPTPVGPSN